MGRAIIRSKIFAKQNIPGTGGGSGSAISVSDEGNLLTSGVTSFNFTGLGVGATAAGTAVTVSVENHTVIEVKNATGSTIPKGAVCYLDPSGTSATHPEILLAAATSETTSSKTIGVAHSAITSGSIGLLIISGEIFGTGAEPLDTSAYNAGALLWLSTTPGQWTTTVPTFPNHSVFIGHVTRRQNTNGRVVIKIQNGFELSELHDTKFTTLNQGDVLMYDDETGPRPFWYNQPMSTSQSTTEILNKVSSGTLITGAWYYVADKPTDWIIFIEAISRTAINSKGVAIYTGSGTPSEMDCWYDLVNNYPYKIYDPKYNNTVEGWTTIQNFKWNDPKWANNCIDRNSIVYIDNVTSIPTFTNNSITDGSILNLAGTIFTNYFSNNVITGSDVNISANTSLDDFVYNVISKTSLIAASTGPGAISYNVVESSNLELYNTSRIIHCNIFGMGFKTGSAIIDTASAFEGCIYNLNEVSTFYADYDLDDPGIYNSGSSTLTLPIGHNQWVGEIRLNGVSSPLYYLTDIQNFPVYHLLQIRNGNTGKISIRDTSTFFKFYSPVTAPDLTATEDYALFTGISPKIGPASGGNMVLLDYKAY